MTKLVIIPGSLRKESLNKKLAEVWGEVFKKNGIEVQIINSDELNVPLINEDDKETKFPASLRALSESVKAAAGVVICTPEYNGSISPVVKNMIDWTSTLSPHPWRAKPVLISGTTPGALATVAGMLHTQNPLDRLGAHVYPQSYGVAFGDKELSGKTLTDSKKQEGLEKLAKDFLAFCARFN